MNPTYELSLLEDLAGFYGLDEAVVDYDLDLYVDNGCPTCAGPNELNIILKTSSGPTWREFDFTAFMRYVYEKADDEPSGDLVEIRDLSGNLPDSWRE